MARVVDESQARHDLASLGEGFCPDDGTRLTPMHNGGLCATCHWLWKLLPEQEGWTREFSSDGIFRLT